MSRYLRALQTKALATLVGISLQVVGAIAQERVPVEYNAETMLKICRGEVVDIPPDVQSMTCTFRIQGVADMMLYNCYSLQAGFNPAPQLSASVSGSRGAVRQTFINYMVDHPEIWDDHWAGALATALSQSFPCENAQPQQ